LLEDIYVKILAFSSYGFPESHAISFAYLVYASAWLKCYYPAAFRAALLCAQPMGFYAPASLIGDVRGHGVTVRGADVNASGVLATLEKTEDPLTGNGALPPDSPPAGGVPVPGQPVIRLGLSEVRNLGTSAAEEIVEGQPYADLEDFARRTTVGVAALEALALGGAFGCFGVSRREALWAAGAAATIRPGQLPGTTLGMTAEAGDVPDLGEHHQRGELPDAGQRVSTLTRGSALACARTSPSSRSIVTASASREARLSVMISRDTGGRSSSASQPRPGPVQ
jgi:error-prone DNA polymerase